MQKHRQQFRKAIIGIIGGTLLAYLGLFWLGYYEDPFHLFSADNRPPNNPKRLSLQNMLASYSYVTKAKQIIDLKPDRIILGSSVENYGMRIKGSFLNYIDPSPEKSEKLRSIFPRNIELYDAAIGGGGLDEAYQYLQHAYVNNPDLNEVVLGLEWREFAASLPNQEMKNLPTVSALDRTSTPVGFLLQYTISKLAMDYALELFGARTPQCNAASRIVRNLLMPEDYIFPKIDKIIAHHLIIQPPDSNAVHASVSREPLFADSGEVLNVAVSLWMANSFHKDYLESGDVALLRPDMLERLKSIVGFCREKNITIRIYLSPQSAFFWDMVRKFGLENNVNRWLREVVKISPVYDFSAQIDFKINHLAYFSDPLHFNEDAGALIIEGLFKERPSFAPKIITPENVEHFIMWRKNTLDSWESDEPRLARLVNLLPVNDPVAMNAVSTSKITDVNMWLVPYEPEYHGYKIYSLLGSFVAVPASVKPPFDLLTLLKKDYPGMLKAGGLKEIQAVINRKNEGGL
jgi:hypothetical protein